MHSCPRRASSPGRHPAAHKGRASLPYREAALLPLKEALQEDREELLYARVFLALANLTHVHLLPAGCLAWLPESLDPSWSLIAMHGALIIVSLDC